MIHIAMPSMNSCRPINILTFMSFAFRFDTSNSRDSCLLDSESFYSDTLTGIAKQYANVKRSNVPTVLTLSFYRTLQVTAPQFLT
jgi:hypothetical protein